MMRSLMCVAAVLVAAHLWNPAGARAADAFPGAEGYGAQAVGWRWGSIIKVTNRNDSGPGSLRACMQRSSPRVCVFETSGTIKVQRPLFAQSNVYVAGQTSPRGIQIVLQKGATKPPIRLMNAHDVLLRFLRVRPGPAARSSSIDAILIENSHTAMIDHCSLAFSVDELFDVAGASRDITVQDSILAYGLRDSTHPKGWHSNAGLICAGGAPCGRVSLVRNLFAHNQNRNPSLQGTAAVGPIEMINNVIYNAGNRFTELWDASGDLDVNFIGNLALVGPDTHGNPYSIDVGDESSLFITRVYVEGNVHEFWRPEDTGPEDLVVEPGGRSAVVGALVGPVQSTVLDASVVLNRVLADAGASRPERDDLDARVVDDVWHGIGRIINSPAQVGGWPELPGQSSSLDDSDDDAMPDIWEIARGIDPDDPSDAWDDADGNGWPDLEDYLNELAE